MKIFKAIVVLGSISLLCSVASAASCKKDGGVAIAQGRINGSAVWVKKYKDGGRCIEKGEVDGKTFHKVIWYDGGRRNVRGYGMIDAGKLLDYCGFGRC